MYDQPPPDIQPLASALQGPRVPESYWYNHNPLLYTVTAGCYRLFPLDDSPGVGAPTNELCSAAKRFVKVIPTHPSSVVNEIFESLGKQK